MSAWGRGSRGAFFGITFGAALMALGCDSAGHPDTGFGGNQPVPATINCADLCQRSADCVVDLCNEDTNSTKYSGTGQAIDQSCLPTCTDADLQALATQTSWNCLFTSTCREAFGEDVCHASARYSCK